MRELALHILDLVQNSIEAGAGKVTLEIVEDLKSDTLAIRVSDNGKGMTQEDCQRAVDPFVTSRKTRKIGLGLPLIQMSAQHCDGFLAIDSAPGKGTTVEAVYRHSHIDRPPLGNMVDTLKTLLVGNPSLDFHYMHIVNTRRFDISTMEITGILGEVPLTHPEVLEWLQEYLFLQLSILYGGAENENP